MCHSWLTLKVKMSFLFYFPGDVSDDVKAASKSVKKGPYRFSFLLQFFHLIRPIEYFFAVKIIFENTNVHMLVIFRWWRRGVRVTMTTAFGMRQKRQCSCRWWKHQHFIFFLKNNEYFVCSIISEKSIFIKEINSFWSSFFLCLFPLRI